MTGRTISHYCPARESLGDLWDAHVKHEFQTRLISGRVMAENYLSSDYFAARSRFRQKVEKAGGQLKALKLDVKGPCGEDLTIDIAWFGPEQPRRVLLHSSGLHGVEGFAGSAIQLQFLHSMPAIPDDAAIILVHILNPYGMTWLRRVNEGNVDLNRNFLGPDEDYVGAPEAYGKLDSFLNPPSPPSVDFFLLRAIWLIVRYGMPTLKQTVAGGQYEYPKGLFFGGKRLEQGPLKCRAYIAEHLAAAEHVVAIDVHTGLGKYGEDTLLVEAKDYETLRPIFGERVKPLDPKHGPAFRIRGGYHLMIHRVLPQAKVYFASQEFGTYNPIKVLHALREENRWHHYGDGSVDHSAKHKLKETFCPDDDSWRRSVLGRGKGLLEQAVELAFAGPTQR